MSRAATAAVAKTMPALAQPVGSPAAAPRMDDLSDGIVWLLVVFLPISIILGAWVLLQNAKYSQQDDAASESDQDSEGWFTVREAVQWYNAPEDLAASAKAMTEEEHAAYVKTIQWPTPEEAAMRQHGVPVAKTKAKPE